MSRSWAKGLYGRLMRPAPGGSVDLPSSVVANVPANALRLVGAQSLQTSGDQIVKASTVLPWVFNALGVPAALTGLLVPIREAGSMLPQAFLTPFVLRVRHRKWIFVVGSAVQAVAAAAMALVTATAEHLTAGILILVALSVFALGRSLCSIASKDVLGRTIPKGERGQINGLSTTVSGLVAITLGLALRIFGRGALSPAQLAWLLAGGAALWVLAALVYARVLEPAGDELGEERRSSAGALRRSLSLLSDDVAFRRFVVVRSLLLVSALSPPFVVSLAASSGAGALSGLGGFIIASGVASLLGGPVFGRLADRSSRRLMAAGAAVASVTLFIVVAVTLPPSFKGNSGPGAILFVSAYFILTFVHTGVRVGRKTYVVDMAEGDRRTEYVAVSNSAMGVILLATGAISSALSIIGVSWALAFLAVLGILGVLFAIRLPDVSTPNGGGTQVPGDADHH